MSNAPFLDISISLAAGDAAGSDHTLDIGHPLVTLAEGRGIATIFNPGGVAVDVSFDNRDDLGGGLRIIQAAQVSVPPGAAVQLALDLWLVGEGPGRINVQPSAAVPAAESFDVGIRARRL